MDSRLDPIFVRQLVTWQAKKMIELNENSKLLVENEPLSPSAERQQNKLNLALAGLEKQKELNKHLIRLVQSLVLGRSGISIAMEVVQGIWETSSECDKCQAQAVAARRAAMEKSKKAHPLASMKDKKALRERIARLARSHKLTRVEKERLGSELSQQTAILEKTNKSKAELYAQFAASIKAWDQKEANFTCQLSALEDETKALRTRVLELEGTLSMDEGTRGTGGGEGYARSGAGYSDEGQVEGRKEGEVWEGVVEGLETLAVGPAHTHSHSPTNTNTLNESVGANWGATNFNPGEQAGLSRSFTPRTLLY
jgi:hypothetical protein